MATETVPLTGLRGKPRAKPNTLTRRTVLAGAAAGPLAGLPAAAAAADPADPVLDRVVELDARRRVLEDAFNQSPADGDEDSRAAELDQVCRTMIETPAGTIRGVLCKMEYFAEGWICCPSVAPRPVSSARSWPICGGWHEHADPVPVRRSSRPHRLP